MTEAERRLLVEDVCEAALQREEGDRTQFVAVACGDDEALRREVEALLSHAERADRFFATPIGAVAAAVLADDVVSLVGRQIGAYEILSEGLALEGVTRTSRFGSVFSTCDAALPSFEGRRVGQYDLIREIGRGGMGAVYEARRADKLFSNHVALKIVLPERSDAELLLRFQQEREIVAKLDHPNIARLFDGGTTDEGLPYSVMEYVDGQPIDVYCDEHRLNTTDRLRLLRTVCLAVQYAHQHLVVHRDLKPSNILVTSDGKVKLLDFGIAKFLGADTEYGRSNLTSSSRLLTLSYASPEQIRGERTATSSDVYSLGVILYELLTGRRPYLTNGLHPHQVIEAICEREPLRPSEVVLNSAEDARSLEPVRLNPEKISGVREGTAAKLARRLSGDLDNIALMALRKEPDRRYRSVEQFGEDLGRHLSGLPVLAQHDTVGYRARKFVERHRVGVITAAMVLLSMAGAVAATSWEARIARAERRRAEGQATEATLQSQRAERQTKEAQFYRQHAEEETEFAKNQLSVAEQQTREADARRREAILEREKAERRARDVQTITTALLDLNDNLSDNPAGMQAGRRAAGFAEQVLSSLSADGFRDSAFNKQVAAVRDLVGKYQDVDTNISRTNPPGWTFDSDHPEDYEFGIDRKNSIAGSSAYIRSRRAQAQGSAELTQTIDAESYRGKRIRLSVELKSTGVENAAGVFARVITAERYVAVRSNGMVPLRGTNLWRRSAIVFEVPDDGAEIAIGFVLRGDGAVWADNFSFDIVGADTPLTAPRGPIDLLFQNQN